MKPTLSVVLATYNEEANIADCLRSVKELASEIVVVDGSSTDKTEEIAKSFGAKVIVTSNPSMFHINKQKALDDAKGPWILQLDADERVTKELASEINAVIEMNEEQKERYENKLPNKKLFHRHQKILQERDGEIGTQQGNYVAFFTPRLNYFLGKYLRYGGVYPDGVIRLVKKNKAHFPCKDVHEQMVIAGKVGWLEHPLLHQDSPTFDRYLQRNNRYTDLMAEDMKKNHVSKDIFSFFKYVFFKPIQWFLMTYIRHKGFLDGWQGFIWAFFSSRRFAISYMKYLQRK